MKTITYEDFVSFNPCWLTDESKRAEHKKQLARYRAMRDEWTALDILRLDDVTAQDRLWLVLREELIDAPVLHEFACRCAERALSLVDKPDKRSLAAIETKRAWMRRECSDDDLAASRAASRASSRAAAWAAACAAACAAARAVARAAERDWQVAELARMLEEGK